MKLFKRGKKFRADQTGAVTVDWVVLTAAIVGLAVGVGLTVRNGTMSLSHRIAHFLGSHVHTS